MSKVNKKSSREETKDELSTLLNSKEEIEESPEEPGFLEPEDISLTGGENEMEDSSEEITIKLNSPKKRASGLETAIIEEAKDIKEPEVKEEEIYRPEDPNQGDFYGAVEGEEIAYDTAREGDLYSSDNQSGIAYSSTNEVSYSSSPEAMMYSGDRGNAPETSSRLRDFNEGRPSDKRPTTTFERSDLIQKDTKKYTESSTAG